MTLLLSLVQLILVVYITICEYLRNSAGVFLWAMLLLVFGIPHFLSSVFQKYNYDLWVYQKASYFVIVFSVLYYIVRRFYNKKCSLDKNEVFMDYKKTVSFLYILIVLFIVHFIHGVYNTYVYSGSLLNTSWSSMRELSKSGGYVSVTSISSLLYFALSSCLFIALLLKKKHYVRFLFILLLMGVLLTRNRVQILPLLVSFVWVYIFKNKRISSRIIFRSIAIAFISVYIVYGLLLFRHAGTIDMFLESFSFNTFNSDIVEYILNGKGELGLREAFYFFIENDNDFDGFNTASTYIRMLLVFIPTSYSFGLKPDDFAITMGSAWSPGISGYSMHPTLFGDCFANLGFLGVFLGVFWGCFVNLCDKLVNESHSYLKYSLLMTFSCCFIIIGRGSVYNAFAFMFYGGMLLVVISFVMNQFIKNKL